MYLICENLNSPLPSAALRERAITFPDYLGVSQYKLRRGERKIGYLAPNIDKNRDAQFTLCFMIGLD